MAAQPLRLWKKGFLACVEKHHGSNSQPCPALPAIPATTPTCVPSHQGQLGEAHGEDGGQRGEVLGRFCILTTSHTQKVADLRDEADLLAKRLADYADVGSLVPRRALLGS